MLWDMLQLIFIPNIKYIKTCLKIEFIFFNYPNILHISNGFVNFPFYSSMLEYASGVLYLWSSTNNGSTIYYLRYPVILLCFTHHFTYSNKFVSMFFQDYILCLILAKMEVYQYS